MSGEPIKRSLTSNIQRSVAADGLSQVVPGDAGVDALVRFAPAAVHYAQEEERAAGQQHAVGTRVIPVRLHALAVLVPLDGRDGPALRLAVEGGGFPLGYDQIRGVLHDPGSAVFITRPGPCDDEGKDVSGASVQQWPFSWLYFTHGSTNE